MTTRRIGRALLAAAVAAAAIAAAALLLRPGRPRPVRLAYQNRIGDAVCIVAVEKGFFRDEALDVQAFRFSNGPACAEAMYAGAADVGTMGDATAVIAVSRNQVEAPNARYRDRRPRFRIIAAHGRGEHRHRLMVQADSPLRTPADLPGKTVAVKKGTSTYGGFLAFLAAAKLDAARLRIIDMKPSEMPAALAAGSVDAFVASEPTPSLAEVRGARQLATLGGLGNSYPVLLLARDDFLRTRPDEARRLLRALHRAEAFIRRNPDAAAAILANVTGLPPDVTRRAMQRHAYHVALDADVLSSLDATARFLARQGIIPHVPDLSAAIFRPGPPGSAPAPAPRHPAPRNPKSRKWPRAKV